MNDEDGLNDEDGPGEMENQEFITQVQIAGDFSPDQS
jgi:hypothetical protein